MRLAFAFACLAVLPMVLLGACSTDSFTGSTDAGADGSAANDATTADGTAPDGGGTCPLTLLNKNTGFETNDGVWALSNSASTFVTTPRSGTRALELRQTSGVNFAFAKQDIGSGHTFVRLWYRKTDSLPEFQTLRLEIQPDGPQRTFGAPWPTTWTCATARVDSGDGGAGTFFVSGYQPNKDAGSSVLVDDLEVFALPANDVVPKACECP